MNNNPFFRILFTVSLIFIACYSYASDNTKHDLKKAENTLISYLQCTSIQEMAKLTVEGEDFAPYLRDFYGSSFKNPTKYTNITFQKSDREWVTFDFGFTLSYGRPGKGRIFLKKVDEDYKIEWKASKGISEIPLNVFQAYKSPEPKQFRVICMLSGDYSGYFRLLDDTYWSIELHDQGGPIQIHGYVRKDSEVGKRLVEILSDGRGHFLTLNLKYPENAISNNEVLIDSIEKETWY